MKQFEETRCSVQLVSAKTIGTKKKYNSSNICPLEVVTELETIIIKNKNTEMNYLGFNKEDTMATVLELNTLLANYHIYYQNLRNFHWNVSGENFFDLHTQFELLYNDARLKIDDIAERILTLRERPLSRISDYMTTAEVEESMVLEDDHKMVETILENHRILIKNMREVMKAAGKIGEEGTIDMIGGFLSDLEKKSWMLDAWKTKKLEVAKV